MPIVASFLHIKYHLVHTHIYLPTRNDNETFTPYIDNNNTRCFERIVDQ